MDSPPLRGCSNAHADTVTAAAIPPCGSVQGQAASGEKNGKNEELGRNCKCDLQSIIAIWILFESVKPIGDTSP